MATLIPILILTFQSSRTGKAAPMKSVRMEKTIPDVFQLRISNHSQDTKYIHP